MDGNSGNGKLFGPSLASYDQKQKKQKVTGSSTVLVVARRSFLFLKALRRSGLRLRTRPSKYVLLKSMVLNSQFSFSRVAVYLPRKIPDRK